MINHQDFFLKKVPNLVADLQPNKPALWGSMNASQMVDHLTAGTRIFMTQKEVEITVPKEKIPLAQEWLMTDANFKEGRRKPERYSEYESAELSDFEKLKTDFLSALQEFDRLTSTQHDFWTVHPSFGKLNAQQIRQLQFKHIRHHFQQFGLMPR